MKRVRRLLVVLLIFCAMVVVAPTAYSSSSCVRAAFSNYGDTQELKVMQASVRLNGAIMADVRGLAWNTDIYNAYLRPRDPYQHASTARTGVFITDSSNTVFYGWRRSRDFGGYNKMALVIEWAGYGNWKSGVLTDPFKTVYSVPIAISQPPDGVIESHRLKFFNNPADSIWYFYYDSNPTPIYTIHAPGGMKFGQAYFHQGVTDTCNAAYNVVLNTWRYSNANQTWFKLGKVNSTTNVAWAKDALDGNNHYDLRVDSAYSLSINCVLTCEVFSTNTL